MNSSEKGSHSIPVWSTVAKGDDPAAVEQEQKPVSMWPGMYHSPVTAALWAARSSIIERHMEFTLNGHPQRELLTRTPAESRTSILYSFSNDKILQEQYRNPWSGIRIGKLLEDLDALAGTIAVKHCADNDYTTRPLMLVTASVDKINLLKPITITDDITVAGAVAWVGRSSMEIRMEVTQVSPDDESEEDQVALVANFTFVARDTATKKAAQINRLQPMTEGEKKLFRVGEATDTKRKQQRADGTEVSKAAKALLDDQRLKDLMTEGRVLREMPTLADRNTILMKDTKLENAIICQPQQRNMHGRIFGGFLMRRAYELAYSTCYVFCGTKPVFLEVDHVDFLRPVDVGDLLRFKSCVLYTETKTQLIHIEVTAHVTQPELRSSEVSNTFYFTFTLDEDLLKEGTPPVFRVVPGTEEEARRVLARYDAENLAKYPLLEKQLSQKKL
ncbi:unnamed protein product [Calypogeia fissa]